VCVCVCVCVWIRNTGVVSSLNLVLNAAVWSAAHLNSVERTCCFHYIGGCGHSRGDVYERFRNTLKECAEKMILTYGNKCLWCMRCGVFFLPLTHVGSITCCNFLVTVLIEGSEINYSVVTKKKENKRKNNKRTNSQFHTEPKKEDTQTGNYVTPFHKEED